MNASCVRFVIECGTRQPHQEVDHAVEVDDILLALLHLLSLASANEWIVLCCAVVRCGLRARSKTLF